MQYLTIFVKAWKRWNKLEMGHHAAAFAYYAPFALIPLVLLSIGISGYFFGVAFVKNIFLSWGTVFGPDLTALIDVAVQNLEIQINTYELPRVAILLFLLVTLFAFNVLASGFVRIWGLRQEGMKAFFRQTFRSAVFVVILQLYIILMIIMEGTWVELAIRELTIFPGLVWFLSISMLFFLLFRFLASNAPSVSACLAGGLATGVLFIFAKNLVIIYLAAKPVLTIFGAAGLILVLLVWVYVLAAIIYYGAIVAHLFDNCKKSHDLG